MKNSLLWKIDRYVAGFFLLLISGYKKYLSPMLWSTRMGQHEDFCCKFYPSCSQYSVLAFEHDWVIVALFKTLWRILRCHPWSEGGIDFPQKKNKVCHE